MLLEFPVEIVLLILAEITDRNDLKNLCETSTVLYKLAVPLLYKSITVRAKDELSLQKIDVEPFLRTCHTPINRLRGVKALEITSQFYTKIGDRCTHRDVGGSLYELVQNLMPLLKELKEDSLRSFTWDLGTCIPHQILGPLGHLPLKQKNIESIRLTTDGACEWNLYGNCLIDLSEFKKLKSLSWNGLRSENDFSTLHGALQQFSNQLVELELDLIDWNTVNYFLMDQDVSVDFFARRILALPPGGRKGMFSALQVLSLSAVSLTSFPEEIAEAFDFSSLRSLKLRLCPGWDDFLQHVREFCQPITLKSLEIQVATEMEDNFRDTITEFLESFEGLEKLFISTNSEKDPVDLWYALLQHKSTLRRFVHHVRGGDNEDLGFAYEDQDRPDLSFTQKEIKSFGGWYSDNPLKDLDLECVGFCCRPQYLEYLLRPFMQKRCLKVLHIRQSGPDLENYPSWAIQCDYFGPDSGISEEEEVLFQTTSSSEEEEKDGDGMPGPSKHKGSSSSSSDDDGLPKLKRKFQDFAQWAFGPYGLPSLRIIAFGDFSYGGRYHQHNVLLCRNTSPSWSGDKNFRHLTEEDHSLWDLLKTYSDVLEACPTGNLFDD